MSLLGLEDLLPDNIIEITRHLDQFSFLAFNCVSRHFAEVCAHPLPLPSWPLSGPTQGTEVEKAAPPCYMRTRFDSPPHPNWFPSVWFPLAMLPRPKKMGKLYRVLWPMYPTEEYCAAAAAAFLAIARSASDLEFEALDGFLWFAFFEVPVPNALSAYLAESEWVMRRAQKFSLRRCDLTRVIQWGREDTIDLIVRYDLHRGWSTLPPTRLPIDVVRRGATLSFWAVLLSNEIITWDYENLVIACLYARSSEKELAYFTRYQNLVNDVYQDSFLDNMLTGLQTPTTVDRVRLLISALGSSATAYYLERVEWVLFKGVLEGVQPLELLEPLTRPDSHALRHNNGVARPWPETFFHSRIQLSLDDLPIFKRCSELLPEHWLEFIKQPVSAGYCKYGFMYHELLPSHRRIKFLALFLQNAGVTDPALDAWMKSHLLK